MTSLWVTCGTLYPKTCGSTLWRPLCTTGEGFRPQRFHSENPQSRSQRFICDFKYLA
jgi:hypothetical protein